MRYLVLVLILSSCVQSTKPEISRIDLKLNDDGSPIIGYQFNRKSEAAIASDVRSGEDQEGGYNINKSTLDQF